MQEILITDWDHAKAKRTYFLSLCDWTQLNDAPLTTSQKIAWATYRQALRDIPETFTNVEDIIWPTEPA